MQKGVLSRMAGYSKTPLVRWVGSALFSVVFSSGSLHAQVTPDQMETIQEVLRKNADYFSSLPENISLNCESYRNHRAIHYNYEYKFSGKRFYEQFQEITRAQGATIFAFDGERYQLQSDDDLQLSRITANVSASITGMLVSCPLTDLFHFVSPSDSLESGLDTLKRATTWKDLESRVAGCEVSEVAGKKIVRVKFRTARGALDVYFDSSVGYYPYKVEFYDASQKKISEEEIKKFAHLNYQGHDVVIPAYIVGTSIVRPQEDDESVVDEKSLSFDAITEVKLFKIPFSEAETVYDLDLKVYRKK